MITIDSTHLWTIGNVILGDLVKGFILSFVINAGLNRYLLYKNEQPKNMKLISGPPELFQTVRTLKKNHRRNHMIDNSIQEFKNVIEEKMNHIDLSLFHNNVDQVTVYMKNFKLNNFIYRNSISGIYDSKTNSIEIDKSDYLDTIDHELMHMASSHYDQNNKKSYCGFHQRSTGINSSIGKGLNEGYTELLIDRYFRSDKVKGLSYHFEKQIASNLETIIGQDKMEQFYMSANLYGLVEELKQYKTEEEVLKFISDVDFMLFYRDEKHLLPTVEKKLDLCMRRVYIFLVETYQKKLNMDEDKSGLNLNRYAMADYISQLKFVVRFNAKLYGYSDLESVLNFIKMDHSETIDWNHGATLVRKRYGER